MQKTRLWLMAASGIRASHKSLLLHMIAWSALLLWLLLSLDWRPLKSPDEARYVTIAWEMWQQQHYGLPTLNSLPFFHKPPLFYWLTGISMQACGQSLFCIRIVPLCAALLTCWALFYFLKRFVSNKVALYSVCLLVTMPAFYYAAQFANPDILITTCTTLTILAAATALFQYEDKRTGRGWLIGAYVMAAFGLLAKGLIGLILPAIVLLAWMLLRRRFYALWWLFSVRGLCLFLLIGLPWFVYIGMQFDGFWHYFFIHHHFERYVDASFNNKQSFWFYFGLLPLVCLPWSLLILKFRLRHWQRLSAREQDIACLFVVWVIGILCFFSLPPSKPPGYLLPVIPAFAGLLTLVGMQYWPAQLTGRWFPGMLLIAGLVCLLCINITQTHDANKSNTLVMQYLKKQVLPDDKVYMLGKYFYELTMALNLKQPVAVVEPWNALNVDRHDNWRRELHEAGQFAQQPLNEILVLPTEVDSSICRQQAEHVWVIGHQAPVEASMLKALQPVSKIQGFFIWKLAKASRIHPCANTNKGTGAQKQQMAD